MGLGFGIWVEGLGVEMFREGLGAAGSWGALPALMHDPPPLTRRVQVRESYTWTLQY